MKYVIDPYYNSAVYWTNAFWTKKNVLQVFRLSWLNLIWH